MIHFLNPPESRVPPTAPLRRRVIIIGAGPTGMSAAFHIGEHALILDRRAELEESHDHSNDIPLGFSSAESLGPEDGNPGSQRAGVSRAERKALYISCASQGQADAQDRTLIHVARWQPPSFTAPDVELASPSVRMLAPLLRGELHLNSTVVRVNASERSVELEDGTRYVFDKLLSTMPLQRLACMVMHELPGRVRHDASLRYWLQDHDIEVSDHATRAIHGEVDEFEAGKRLADLISTALTDKFRGGPSLSGQRPAPLFQPRLVPRQTI